MDKKGGWIKLYRSATENWTFDNEEKKCSFAAWVDLLLMVNHENKKIMIRGNLIEIQRGQKLTSIAKLSKRWKWTERKTSNFLKQLQDDGMIFYESSRTLGTLITVRNYAIFQGDSRTDDSTDSSTDNSTDDSTTAEQTAEQNAYKQEDKNIKNDEENKKLNPRPWGGMLEPE